MVLKGLKSYFLQCLMLIETTSPHPVCSEVNSGFRGKIYVLKTKQICYFTAECGCRAVGQQPGLVTGVLHCVLHVPQYVATEQRFDLLVLVSTIQPVDLYLTMDTSEENCMTYVTCWMFPEKRLTHVYVSFPGALHGSWKSHVVWLWNGFPLSMYR